MEDFILMSLIEHQAITRITMAEARVIILPPVENPKMKEKINQIATLARPKEVIIRIVRKRRRMHSRKLNPKPRKPRHLTRNNSHQTPKAQIPWKLRDLLKMRQ